MSARRTGTITIEKMTPATAATALLAVLLTSAALAQESIVERDELWRASSGEIDMRGRQAGRLSGSLAIGASGGADRFYEATLGATVVPDRLWFFGSAQRSVSTVAPWLAPQPLQGSARTIDALDGKFAAAIGDRNSLSASLSASRDDGIAATIPTATVPATFLSMHYTGIVSSNAFFTASVTRSRQRPAPQFLILDGSE